jgi:hypothetical protein
VYVRPAGGEAGELVEVDFLTRDPERPLFDAALLEVIAISEDGSRIVFKAEDAVFISDLDGDGAEQIIDDDGFTFEADLFEPDD